MEHRDRGTTRERKHRTDSTERLHMEDTHNLRMSDHTDGQEAEQHKRFAVQKSVLQKESQVAVWEAKVEQCKQELADLERNLAQARGELIEAKAQQGWSGACAVGMGGAGAVFSSAAAATSATGAAPASQLSNVFSTLSPMPHVMQKQQRDLCTTSVSVDIAKKRMLEGHAPGGPQGKRSKYEEHDVDPANASGLAAASVPHPSAAKKPQKAPALCEHQRQRSRCKDCGGSGLCEHQRRKEPV